MSVYFSQFYFPQEVLFEVKSEPLKAHYSPPAHSFHSSAKEKKRSLCHFLLKSHYVTPPFIILRLSWSLCPRQPCLRIKDHSHI